MKSDLIIGTILVGVIFAATGLSLVHYKVFAPKFADAQREVYENSTSYIQGKTQILNKYRGEYALANDSQKLLLKSVILREATTVDNSKLPVDIQMFIQKLKDE